MPEKPHPYQRPAHRAAGVLVRMDAADRERLNALAAREGITVQQLALYAFDLALAAYGAGSLQNREA